MKDYTPEIVRADESAFSVIDVIPTGLPQLDHILGIGGIPTRRITEIVGQNGVGKTTLSLLIVREAQRLGIECVWADVEWSWENIYASKFGVDLHELRLIKAPYAEEVLDLLEAHATKNEGCLYVVDSVGGLHSRFEAEKNAGEKTIGAQASAISVFCRKMTPIVAIHNHALIFINHEYMPIGGKSWLPSGGVKLAYHKSLSIRLTKSFEGAGELTKKEGMVVDAEIKKNKLASTVAQKCRLHMIYGDGFSAVSDLTQMAMDKGVFRKVGNTYFFGEEKLGMKKKVAELMKDDAFAERVKALV